MSPETISKIATGPIDETWSKVLSDVDRRATAHKKKTSEPWQSKANDDLGPLLEKLIQKVSQIQIRPFQSFTDRPDGRRTDPRFHRRPDQGPQIPEY